MSATSFAMTALPAGTGRASASQRTEQPPLLRALAFDAYGTLFDVFSVTALAERLFPGQGTALAQLWRAKQLQYSLLRSMMGRYQDFWRLTEDGLVYACRFLKLELTPAARTQLMEAYLRLDAFADARPALEALRQRGVRLAILSNGAPPMLAAVAQHAGIASLFDAIVSVDSLKIFKPAPAVYALASERLQVDTRAIGFVSANSWDINGAASVGLTTFWIQRTPGDPPEELGFSAAHVVRSLVDLIGIVAP